MLTASISNIETPEQHLSFVKTNIVQLVYFLDLETGFIFMTHLLCFDVHPLGLDIMQLLRKSISGKPNAPHHSA